MQERKVRYVRKLSGGESLEHYIMIMKDSLKLFPNPGVPFTLKAGTEQIETQVKMVDCWCQGPKKPHVHYRIDFAPLLHVFRPHYGQTVTLEKTGDNTYELS